VIPCANPRSPGSIHRESDLVAIGNAPDSPTPNRNRIATIEVAFHASTVADVNTLHHVTISASARRALPTCTKATRSGSGVGGSILFRALPAKRLSLGTLEFSDAAGVEALSADALGFDNEDGLIGSDLLKQFTLYLDYASNRIYLQSSPHLGALATPPAHRY